MDNKIEIKQVDSIEECEICDNFLGNLIVFESKLDEEINDNHQIKDYYKRTLGREDTAIFLALFYNEPVGYVIVYKPKENPAMKNNMIKIMNLFVREDFRDKKIGTKLMQAAENWAKKFFTHFNVELDCIAGNMNAIEFYKNLGYVPVRTSFRKKI